VKRSKKIASAGIIMFLLIITTYTSILLLLSNNKPLYAEVRTLVHGRSIATPALKLFFPKNYSFKQPKPSNTSSNQSANLNNNISISELGEGVRIALVEPTFTAAAYNNSFYAFYQKYAHIPTNANITTDLNFLTSKVTAYPTITPTTKVHSAFAMLSLLKDLRLTSPESNITVLTDPDVDNGSIFKNNNNSSNMQNIIDTNNSNAYDVVIIGHQEYVTQQEYNNLKRFVSNGGTLIILDSNVFYAEVKYDMHTNTITMVKGHGWAFNGRSAWKSIAERWAKETSQWVGSNYLCYSCNVTFANDPFEYQHHEEQYITNPNDKILMNYNASLLNYSIPLVKPVIATYELNFERGKVISLGIYSDDIIANHNFDKYFNRLFLQYSKSSE
jgi:N,N-dimethylformamidase beta subunit-like protein